VPEQAREALRAKLKELNLPKPGSPPMEMNMWRAGDGYVYDYEQDYAVFWHPTHGAHLVYGAILQRYRAMGNESSFLGFPTTDEMDSAFPHGRISHFVGGDIVWAPGDTAARELRGGTGQCFVSFDSFRLLNKMSDTDHSDNDYLCMAWSVNDKVYNKTVALVNQDGSQILDSGNVIKLLSDYVVCANSDHVVMAFSVVNLGAYKWSEQADKAARFTGEIAAAITPIYLKVAAEVLRNVGPIGGPVASAIAQGAASVIDEFSGKLGQAVGSVFDSAIVPVVSAIVEGTQYVDALLGGQPNCNGVVLSDYVVFTPGQPAAPLHISKVYEGPERSLCGNRAHTQMEMTLQRRM